MAIEAPCVQVRCPIRNLIEESTSEPELGGRQEAESAQQLNGLHDLTPFDEAARGHGGQHIPGNERASSSFVQLLICICGTLAMRHEAPSLTNSDLYRARILRRASQTELKLLLSGGRTRAQSALACFGSLKGCWGEGASSMLTV